MDSLDEKRILEEAYFHVALPRDVPGRESKYLFNVEAKLLDFFIAAVKTLVPLVPLEHQTCVDALRLALVTSKALNVEGKLDQDQLAKEIGDLTYNHALILHVTEQNAALLIYKETGYVLSASFNCSTLI